MNTIKNRLSTRTAHASFKRAMLTPMDYFIAGKTLIVQTADSSVVGWFSDKQLAEELCAVYNEKQEALEKEHAERLS